MLKNLLTLDFSFQGVPTEPFEEGQHYHHKGSVRKQLEEDETFEQVIIFSQHQYHRCLENLTFTFQNVYIELVEIGNLEHHRMGVTEQLEDDETFEQVIVNINLLVLRQTWCHRMFNIFWRYELSLSRMYP